MQVGDEGEGYGSDGGDAGAEAVHVVEDAEGSGDAYDPDDGEDAVENVADPSADEDAENLGVDAAEKQNRGSQGHAEEEFYLMVQPAAIVEDTYRGDQGSGGENAFNLSAGGAVKHEEYGNHHRAVHGQAAEKRNGTEMDLARAGQVDHADTQCQGAHRNDKQQRCEKGD